MRSWSCRIKILWCGFGEVVRGGPHNLLIGQEDMIMAQSWEFGIREGVTVAVVQRFLMCFGVELVMLCALCRFFV